MKNIFKFTRVFSVLMLTSLFVANATAMSWGSIFDRCSAVFTSNGAAEAAAKVAAEATAKATAEAAVKATAEATARVTASSSRISKTDAVIGVAAVLGAAYVYKKYVYDPKQTAAKAAGTEATPATTPVEIGASSSIWGRLSSTVFDNFNRVTASVFNLWNDTPAADKLFEQTDASNNEGAAAAGYHTVGSVATSDTSSVGDRATSPVADEFAEQVNAGNGEGAAPAPRAAAFIANPETTWNPFPAPAHTVHVAGGGEGAASRAVPVATSAPRAAVPVAAAAATPALTTKNVVPAGQWQTFTNPASAVPVPAPAPAPVPVAASAVPVPAPAPARAAASPIVIPVAATRMLTSTEVITFIQTNNRDALIKALESDCTIETAAWPMLNRTYLSSAPGLIVKDATQRRTNLIGILKAIISAPSARL